MARVLPRGRAVGRSCLFRERRRDHPSLEWSGHIAQGRLGRAGIRPRYLCELALDALG